MKQRLCALLCALALAASLTACRDTSGSSGNARSGGNTLTDDVERGVRDAEDGLRDAKDDLESDLDRMIDNGDLTDKR